MMPTFATSYHDIHLNGERTKVLKRRITRQPAANHYLRVPTSVVVFMTKAADT